MKFAPLRYGLCLLFIICNTLLQAQPLLRHIEKLTTDKGLSNNTVLDIAQDKEGFLWIATRHGLNRYDGTEVVQYYAGKQPGYLPDNIIYRLIPSDSSHIILATHQGLSVLDTHTDSFRNILLPSGLLTERHEQAQQPVDNRVFLLEKDAYGNFWVGSPSGIYRLDKDLHLRKIFSSGYKTRDIEGTRVQYVYKIIPLSTGEVLCWLNSGVYCWQPSLDNLIDVRSLPDKKWNFLNGFRPDLCFRVFNRYLAFINYKKNTLSVIDDKTGEIASCILPGNNDKKTSTIQCISGLNDGWLALSFSTRGVAWVRLFHRNGKLSLTSDGNVELSSHAFGRWNSDAEGNLWITNLTDGLWKVSPGKQVFGSKELKDRQGKQVLAYETMSFYKIKKRLFVCVYGDGFYEWDLISNKMNHHSAQHGFHSENMVWNLYQHTEDALWIGTQQGLLWYNLNNKKLAPLAQPHPSILDSFAITTQFSDSKKLLWMGVGSGKGVCVYNHEKKTFKTYVYSDDAYPFRYPLAIGEDKDHNLWFISDATPHLVQWIRKENRFRKVMLSQFKGSAYVQSGGFYLNPQKGLIWYGVQSAGLVRYD
ncbi:MAG: ligand-binding sensor domain-containing protein, partial [Chitinophagaceae bacterium]